MFVSLANLTAYKGYIVLAEALHLRHEAVMEHKDVFDIILLAKEMPAAPSRKEWMKRKGFKKRCHG